MAQTTTDSSFYVTCMSNKCREFFPNNRTSRFSTKLRNPISLNNGKWEVGVSSFIYQQSINNFGESLLMEMILYDGFFVHTITLPDTHVSSPEDVVFQLESALRRYSDKNKFRKISSIISKKSDLKNLDELDFTETNISRKRKRDVSAVNDVSEEQEIQDEIVKKIKTDISSPFNIDEIIHSFMLDILSAMFTIEFIGFSEIYDRLFHMIYCLKIKESVELSWENVCSFIRLHFPKQFENDIQQTEFLFQFIRKKYSDNSDYIAIIDIIGAIFNYDFLINDLLANGFVYQESNVVKATNVLQKRLNNQYNNKDNDIFDSEMSFLARKRAKQIMSTRTISSEHVFGVIPKHFFKIMNNDPELTKFVNIFRDIKSWYEETITMLNGWKTDKDENFFSCLFSVLEIHRWIESYRIRIQIGEQANSQFLTKFSDINTRLEQNKLIEPQKIKRRVTSDKQDQYISMRKYVGEKVDELINHVSESGVSIDDNFSVNVFITEKQNLQADQGILSAEDHWRLMMIQGARFHLEKEKMDSFNTLIHNMDKDPYWAGYDVEQVRELMMTEEIPPREVLRILNSKESKKPKLSQEQILLIEENENQQTRERDERIRLLKEQLEQERVDRLQQFDELFRTIEKLKIEKKNKEDEENQLKSIILKKENDLKTKLKEIKQLEDDNKNAILKMEAENKKFEQKKKKFNESKKFSYHRDGGFENPSD